MIYLTIKCWLMLLRFEIAMRAHNLRAVYALVRNEPVNTEVAAPLRSSQAVTHAIDMACILYFKRVLCLQRSAATAILLRRYGHSADLVIGAQVLPFKSHAWVEIEGSVVNDKPYMTDIYQVLERC